GELLAKVAVTESEPVRAATVAEPDKPFAGKKFVFTGTLQRLTRPEAQAIVEAQGGRAVGSVSKSTHYVVIGEDAGSKAESAAKLGVATLDEDGFFALLRENGIEVPEPG